MANIMENNAINQELLIRIYKAIPEDGTLNWSLLNKLGFANNINTLINHKIIKRVSKGKYILLTVEDIVELSRQGKHFIGALVNCLHEESRVKDIYLQLVIAHLKRHNVVAAFKYFTLFAKVYYEEGILITDSDRYLLYFIVSAYKIFTAGDANLEISDEDNEMFYQFEDNYKYGYYQNKIVDKILNNKFNIAFIPVCESMNKQDRSDYLTCLNILKQLLYPFLIEHKQTKRCRANDSLDRIEAFIDEENYVGLIDYIGYSTDEYFLAIKYLAEILLHKAKIKQITCKNTDDVILDFIYKGLFNASLILMPAELTGKRVVRLINRMLSAVVKTQKEEVTLDSIVNIIEWYNSKKVYQCNIFETLYYYFYEYFEGNKVKIRIAYNALYMFLIEEPYLMTDIGYTLYALKCGEYSLLVDKYKKIGNAAPKSTFIDNLTSEILKDLRALILGTNREEQELLDLSSVQKAFIRAKNNGNSPKITLPYYGYFIEKPAKIPSIEEFKKTNKPFKVIGPLSCETAKSYPANEDEITIDTITFCGKYYVLFRNHSVDTEVLFQKNENSLDLSLKFSEILGQKEPSISVLEEYLAYFEENADYENAIAIIFLLMLVTHKNLSSRYDDRIFDLTEKMRSEPLVSPVYDELSDIVFSSQQKLLEIVGPLSSDESKRYLQYATKSETMHVDEIIYEGDHYIIFRNSSYLDKNGLLDENKLDAYFPISISEQSDQKTFIRLFCRFITDKELNADAIKNLADIYYNPCDYEFALSLYIVFASIQISKGKLSDTVKKRIELLKEKTNKHFVL